MSKYQKRVGKWGEQKAKAYLLSLGYEIVTMNEHTPYGEIDIIALQEIKEGRRQIVFVEVKTRTSQSFGNPEDSVNIRKQEHLLSSAAFFIQQHPELGDDWRIDVIAIQYATPKSPLEIVHFENALGG